MGWGMFGKATEVQTTFTAALPLGVETAYVCAVTAAKRYKLDYDFLFPALKSALAKQKTFNLELTEKGVLKGISRKDITDLTCLPLIQALRDFVKKDPQALAGYQINITLGHTMNKTDLSKALISLMNALPSGFKMNFVFSSDKNQELTDDALQVLCEAGTKLKLTVARLVVSKEKQENYDQNLDISDEALLLGTEFSGPKFIDCPFEPQKKAATFTAHSA